jgi:16S rRNA (cytosine967-C5)-methyltransferase
MSSSKSATARSVAASVLTRAEPKKAEVVRVLAEFLSRTDEPQRTTDLVFGVLKNRALIDTVIEKYSAVPIKRVTSKILNILRVASYELIYCPLSPQYAIVSQAVESVKAVAGQKQTGFVNAVLRQTSRHIINREKTLADAPVQNIVPQNLLTGCLFDLDILPEPGQSPEIYLAETFSLPRWLVSNWLKTFGVEQTRQICFASNRRPSIYLRPNTLKTTVEELADKLQNAGVQCEIVPEMGMIQVNSPGAISALPGFSEGLFTVQDISAGLPVRLLRPKQGWSILDLCAAPGTKTTQLVEATGARAQIFATDIDQARLEKLKDGLGRLGLSKDVTVLKFEELNNRRSGFDCVLLDSTCSNTGVLARRPEVRYRLTVGAVEKLADIQLGLLSRAKELLRPGGVICYSTCSIQPGENNLLVRRFLAENNDFELKLEKLTLPSAEGFDCDGGFTAVIANKAGN